MKTVHLFENAYYLITNQAVAKCFMFRDKNDCTKFKEKIDHYLSPLCDVLAYGFAHDSFQLVVKLKSRAVFQTYYLDKFGISSGSIFIPESTYIFAQAMANMQSGYAKFFNFKYGRDGGLMKARYGRHLIESEGELDGLIEKIHSLVKVGKREEIWTFRRKGDGFLFKLSLDSSIRTSKSYCLGSRDEKQLKCLVRRSKIVMRGHFDRLPQKRIEFKNTVEKLQNLVSFLLLKSKI